MITDCCQLGLVMGGRSEELCWSAKDILEGGYSGVCIENNIYLVDF